MPKSDEDINFIELLLGPRGETLRAMEKESGARVMIRGRGSTKDGLDEEKEDLHVLIVGRNDDHIRRAEDMVRDILFDPSLAVKLKERQLNNLGGRAGATMDDPSIKSITIAVKKTVAGSIIGRGGEVIRELKDKSGANIVVNDDEDPDNRGCIVHIRGSKKSVEKAEELVMNIIRDTEAAIADRLAGRVGSLPNDDRITFDVSVPEDRVGLVIGARGATIKALQARYNVKINVTTPEENTANPQVRLVYVLAPNQTIFNACNEEIQRIIAPPVLGMGNMMGGATQNEIYSVPQDKIGLVIGKGGSTIKGIQANTGCKVQVQPLIPDNFMRGISLEGTDQQRQAAKEEIDGVIAAYAAGNYKTYSQERFGQFQQQAQQYNQQQYSQQQYTQQQMYYDQQQHAAQWQAYYAQQAQQQAAAAASNGAVATGQEQKYTREQWKAWKAYYDQFFGENSMPSSPPPHLLLEEEK